MIIEPLVVAEEYVVYRGCLGLQPWAVPVSDSHCQYLSQTFENRLWTDQKTKVVLVTSNAYLKSKTLIPASSISMIDFS